METRTNKFGADKIYDISDLTDNIYFGSTACMSVLADARSWINSNEGRVCSKDDSEDIVLLCCQVTDLAILHDYRIMEKLIKEYPNRTYYISGCLAIRFDIQLPDNVKRLELPHNDYTYTEDRGLLEYFPPFWIPDYDENDSDFEDGHLFRNMYPLKIGRGCPFSCTYCTIRTTRGTFTELDDYEKLEKEFLEHDNVVLIADSPQVGQIKKWCEIATRNNKPISIRNIEPKIAVKCYDELIELSKRGLLKIFHCPIQSLEHHILKDMGRDVIDTYTVCGMVEQMKKYNTFTATNIIIHYKGMSDRTYIDVKQMFDYSSWNPLWEGVWDRKKAEERFNTYLGKECFMLR